MQMICVYLIRSYFTFYSICQDFLSFSSLKANLSINWFLPTSKLMVARINYSHAFNIIHSLMFLRNQFLHFSFSFRREFEGITGSQK